MKRVVPILLVGSSLLLGQFTKEGTTAAQFLKLGVGARAMGMGAAYVALADDGTAHYWNPAGLAAFESVGAALMHHNWVLDIRHDYLSLAMPAGNVGVFGLSFTMLSMDEKEITTVEEPKGTGMYYRVQDLALGLSYARQVSDRLRFGMTAKYISLTAHNEHAQTMAVDIGSILRTGFYGLKIGMALSNFGGNIQYDGQDLIGKVDIDKLTGNVLADARLATEPWPLPLIVRIGIASDLVGPGPALLSSSRQRLTFALEATHPNDAPERVNFGLEYSLGEILMLRAGYRTNYDLGEFTFGAGMRMPLPSLDMAVFDFAVMPMEFFGNVTRTSVEIRF